MGYFKRFWQPERRSRPITLVTYDNEPLTEEHREWLRQERERRERLEQEEQARRYLRIEEKQKRLEFEKSFRAWIYFMREPDGGFIKIGVSTRINLDDRFYELRRRYGKGVQFLGAFEGDAKEERILHKMLANFRTSLPRDEWFYPVYPVLFITKYFSDSALGGFYWPEKHETPDLVWVLQ